MSKARQTFIESVWQKYPEFPRGGLKYGRVHQLRLGTQNIADWKPIESDSFKASDILIDGDLIVSMPTGRFVLLTPNLTEESGFFLVQNDPWTKKRQWFEYHQLIRQFFKDKRFIEVKTPTLVVCPGTEPSLDVFETTFELGSKKIHYFLPTSPELNLKKLLSEGAERVFEIAAVFRNGELTDRHLPEFLMLEWYRSFAGLPQIKHDVIELIEFLSEQLKVDRPKEVLTFTVADLFKKYCDFNLTPFTTELELRNLAEKLNIDIKSATTIDDVFFLIFMEKIEYQWPADRLVFVEKYPPYQAALARIDKEGWAERFEAYWQGYELANAFHELNDPYLQRARATEDLNKKRLAGKKPVTLDEEFFKSLEFGMPPSSGVALGLERLYMVLRKIDQIEKIGK